MRPPIEPPRPAPPGAVPRARALVRALAAPVERFLAVEASSGIVLFAAAALALGLANSPYADAFASIWLTEIGVSIGAWNLQHDLHWWINDGLMVVFFFVVGMEIRREMYVGELSELRRAALPGAAALGGMMSPALIYLAFNQGTAGAAGWGVPMATDIAFAVGVLALLGDRVPPAMRIFLLSLAVIDDLGAILVIALFYSDGVSVSALGLAALGLGTIPVLQAFGARNPALYAPGAIVAWLATYEAGVHPTIAGVLIGMLTPVRAWLGPEALVETAELTAREVRAALRAGHTSGHAVQVHLGPLHEAAREAVSPGERLTHALHTTVAYGIMPLFALANAGVSLGSASLQGGGVSVFLGVVLGLVVGKFVGVLGLTWLAVRSGLCRLPSAMGWRSVSVIGACAGIGFTMALFVAQLAFPPGPLLEVAKLAVLVASVVAGVLAFVFGRAVLEPGSVGPVSAAEAEMSTED